LQTNLEFWGSRGGGREKTEKWNDYIYKTRRNHILVPYLAYSLGLVTALHSLSLEVLGWHNQAQFPHIQSYPWGLGAFSMSTPASPSIYKTGPRVTDGNTHTASSNLIYYLFTPIIFFQHISLCSHSSESTEDWFHNPSRYQNVTDAQVSYITCCRILM
jgi:hypothetical protein